MSFTSSFDQKNQMLHLIYNNSYVPYNIIGERVELKEWTEGVFCGSAKVISHKIRKDGDMEFQLKLI